MLDLNLQPIDPLELFISVAAVKSIKFIYSYMASKNLIDRYPPHLQKTVDKMKSLISKRTYKEIMSESHVIIPICLKSGWVLKGSSKNDISCNISPFIDYKTGNSEGMVYQTSVCLIDRVQNANFLRGMINNLGLKMIYVPEEYVCSYPDHLISNYTVFYNHRCFVLAEECSEINPCETTFKKAISLLTQVEKKQLAKELVIFLRNSGVLDFHFENFTLRDKKFVLFDTEPFALTLPSYLTCISAPLKEAKINYQNVSRKFKGIPEAEIIVNKCEKAIRKIRVEERSLLIGLIQKVMAVAVCLFLHALTVLH